MNDSERQRLKRVLEQRDENRRAGLSDLAHLPDSDFEGLATVNPDGSPTLDGVAEILKDAPTELLRGDVAPTGGLINLMNAAGAYYEDLVVAELERRGAV